MDSLAPISQEICAAFDLEAFAERLLRELDTSDAPVLAAGPGGGSPFVPDPTIKRAWRYLHDEIHALVCTKSTKYAEERRSFSALTTPLILLFGGLLTQQFGLAAATASSLAALALAMPIKLGRNA